MGGNLNTHLIYLDVHTLSVLGFSDDQLALNTHLVSICLHTSAGADVTKILMRLNTHLVSICLHTDGLAIHSAQATYARTFERFTFSGLFCDYFSLPPFLTAL